MSPGAIIAAPRALSITENTPLDSLRSPIPSAITDLAPETSAIYTITMDDTSPRSSGVPDDIRAILQSLPTKSDIEGLILRIEEAHSRDIQEVRADLHTLTVWTLGRLRFPLQHTRLRHWTRPGISSYHSG